MSGCDHRVALSPTAGGPPVCSSPAERIQPSLKFLQPPQELTSHRCQWTENAAAGKMAPEPAPLKGENFSLFPTPSFPVNFPPTAARVRSRRLPSCVAAPRSSGAAFLPCCEQLAEWRRRRGTFKLTSVFLVRSPGCPGATGPPASAGGAFRLRGAALAAKLASKLGTNLKFRPPTKVQISEFRWR